MDRDLLEGARWELCTTHPGALSDPAALDDPGLHWCEGAVPGTGASARAEATRSGAEPCLEAPHDDRDCWFRCRFPAEPGRGSWWLELDGLATLGDVWLNGTHLLHSENMFVSHRVEIDELFTENELVVRCGALEPVLMRKHPRPRWKSYMVEHQNLRWYRTTLLGRVRGWAVTAPPVGPWRPIRLTAPTVRVLERHIVASCDGRDGVVEVALRLRADGRPVPTTATVLVGSTEATLPVEVEGAELCIAGVVRVPAVERWWPRTHGAQPLYPVTVELDGVTVGLGRIGFRTVEVDEHDGGFQLLVNGVAVFCRGACFFPVDATSLAAPAAAVRSTLELARAAHMNMVRVPGTTVYPDDDFWSACDELGLLVWQDCMFAFLDPPDDEDFLAEVERELFENLGRAGGHPSVAVVCGGQEIEEIPAMMGIHRARWTFPLLEKTVPSVLAKVLPGVPYVSSNPVGGSLPFQMDTGVSQYFGVGGYLRPIDDARRAQVRFTTECLCLATPPERQMVDELLGGPTHAGHDPLWKQGLHHDAGRSWDMDDVRAFYVRELFGVDPLHERYTDPERALDLGRAANAELMSRVFTEWRRPGSSSAGGLVLALRDLRPGAGWGVVDSTGVPKAPWFTLERVFRPVAILLTDEGLNGLRLHLVNDTAASFRGRLRVELFAAASSSPTRARPMSRSRAGTPW